MIPGRIGVVTGSVVEARCLRRLAQVPVACSGANSGRAADEARRLIDRGTEGLVSFGFAGGLDPALRAGDLLLPERVIEAGADRHGLVHEVAGPWRRTLAAKLLEAGLTPRADAILGSDRMIGRPADKAELHQLTGALAVDMESHTVARIAEAAGLPWLIVRAIADPAGFALPAFLADVLGSDGRVRPGVIARAVMRRPTTLPVLLRLSAHSRTARQTLERVAPLLVN